MTALLGFPNELRLWPGGTAPGNTNFTLNAATDALEVVFTAADAVTITRLGFRQGALTGVAPVFRVSLQGVDASGNPDGSIKNSGNAYFDYTPTVGNNTTFQWVTLGATYACARGEPLALVIARTSGTIDGSNNCSFTATSAVGAVGTTYAIQNDAGSRTRQTVGANFGYGSASTAYGLPALTPASTAFNSGSTPDELALYLTVPTAFCSTYKIAGATLYAATTAGTTFTLSLYDTDGTTVLQSVTPDTDHDQAAATARGRHVLFDEASLSTLTAGSTYRLAVIPSASNVTLGSLVVAASADLDAYPFGQAWASGSSRTNAGAWTDSDVTRYGINPILADVTVPSGGSGGGSQRVIGG